MTTEIEEPIETTELTNAVVTDDGLIVTPTPSTTKASLFDRSASMVVAIIALLVVVGVGLTMAFSMGMATNKQEITSTTYNSAGVCLKVQSFMIATNESGEDKALFAKYQAAHPNETPNNVGCPIPFENNTGRH